MPYKDPVKQYKCQKISSWKKQGLKGDYEKIYEKYINTTNCDLCNIELIQGNKGRNKKCMEHNHNTGEFRNIVCHNCNIHKSDIKKRTDNTSGYKHISYCNTKKKWVYEKVLNGKRIHFIRRKNKIDILCIKFAGIILNNT